MRSRECCDQHVSDVEMGSFTPLYGQGGLGTTVFKRLASLLAAWYDQPYSSVMAWPDALLVFP